ncbi:MAG: SDR family oxidoreductase [Rhodothermales bacterium]
MNVFENQHVIVTGSTSGIGEATARLLVERGASGMLITGRHEGRGQKVVRDLKEAGCNAVFVKADLENVDDCRRIIDTAENAFGEIHVLVNAAALTSRGSIFDSTVELWDKMMAINMRAPFILMQACIKNMRRHKIEGAIVNVLSVAAHGGQPFIGTYSASKGGLAVLTKNTAYAVMRHRIRVNGLMLGWADTPWEHDIQKTYHDRDENWLGEAEADLPFGRLIKPDEAARAIAWMASSESGMMTGSLIDFDQSVLGAGNVSRPVAGEMGTE